MGWTSQDDLINQITTNGKADTVVYQKTTVAAGNAGFWQHLFNSIGTIPAATFGGAEATFVPTDNTWTEGAIPISDQTAPATKHILNMGASVVAAAGAPWFILPIDLVGYAKLTTTNVSTTGAKTITMTPIASTAANVDRYPEGEGLRMFVGAYATMGANAPTCTIQYQNSAGVGSRNTASFTSTATATNGKREEWAGLVRHVARVEDYTGNSRCRRDNARGSCLARSATGVGVCHYHRRSVSTHRAVGSHESAESFAVWVAINVSRSVANRRHGDGLRTNHCDVSRVQLGVAHQINRQHEEWRTRTRNADTERQQMLGCR